MAAASEHPAGARARVGLAFAIGAAIALVIVLAASGGDVNATAEGDGLIYRYVALNLDTPPEEVHPVVVERGTSLRYGRIGLPGAMWLLAFGRPGAIPYTHALLVILSMGAAAAALVALLPGAGLAGVALAFLIPAMPLSLAGGFAEIPAIAAGLWAVVLALRERWVAAAALLSVAILTKEGMILVLAGLAVWAAMQAERRARALVPLAAALVPVGAWWLVVRARWGHLPILDPYLDDFDGHAGTPFVALVRGLLDPPHARGLIAALAFTALGVAALRLWRTSVFGLLAAVATVQLWTAGPFAWEFIGEAVRVFLPLQLFAALAFIARRRPEVVAAGARGVTLARHV